MNRLSISTAWEETKAILGRDGRLFVSVALAMIALPAAVTGLLSPSTSKELTPLWVDCIVLIASLIALAGQLALIRLALGPSVTVGGAIGHGLRRLPVYVAAAILIVLVLMLAAIPFAAVLAATGVPIESGTLPATPGVVLLVLVYVALVCLVAVRMLMTAPAASAEAAGPLTIIRRSLQLTAGHFWALFGFLLMFFVGAVVVLIAIGAASGVVVALLIGPMITKNRGRRLKFKR